MDTRSFLGLAPGRPTHWRFPVTPGLCSFSGNLFGGAALAAGIEAMEAITGRRVVWASAQYLSFAKNGDVLDLEVTIHAVDLVLADMHLVQQLGLAVFLQPGGIVVACDASFAGNHAITSFRPGVT